MWHSNLHNPANGATPVLEQKMYQLPVGNLEKIRKSRKRVKNILCEIGLENCKDLLGELKSFDAGDKSFHNTDWADFTEGHNGKRRKKWRYRTQALCCSLCRFSARSWYTFKSHIQRCHEEEQDLSTLSACSCCPFIAQPRVIAKHFKIFHAGSVKPPVFTAPATVAQSATGAVAPAAGTTDRYSCRKCTYQDSLIYCMKKHVLLNHYISILNRYFGQRTDTEQKSNGPNSPKYYCKMCCLSAESSEHLIYHILSSDKHKELEVHIKALIYEHGRVGKKYLPNLAPKAVQHVYGGALVSGTNDQQPGKPRPDGGPVPGGSLSGTVLHGAPHSTTTLVCAPGTSQAFLPAQASALVQLASAEAKGLLRPASVVATQPPRGVSATLPVTGGLVQTSVGTSLPSIVSQGVPKQLPIAVGVPTQQQPQQPRQVLLPPGVQVNVQGSLGLQGPGPQSLLVTQRLPLSQPSPRGAMLASQSLLRHLIPTGNKVNGLPTYTLAPLQVTMPIQSGAVQAIAKAPPPVAPSNPPARPQAQANKPQPVTDPAQNSTAASKQAKKWITCPVCNELFPSNVYQVHIEVAHKASAKTKLQGLAARAPFLKKMPDKTVKCLICKILLSEKGLFEHMLHGLSCLYCPRMFYSVKQLVEHTKAEHSPSQKANCDFMRREYRLYTDDHGNLLFPYFDINTTAPKELLGDKELNLALVTCSLDLIFLKMSPGTVQPVCRAPVKTNCTDCPFCPEKLQSVENYHLHLKAKHYIMPTIHAILKTPAFKCIYCSGVYTGKTTPKAISIHVQRCRCAPKTSKDVERLINPDPASRPAIVVNRAQPGAAAAAPPPPPQSNPRSSDGNADLQSKLRLEMAVREAVEANKREREARVAKRRRLDTQKDPVQLEGLPDLPFPLLLDPTGMEMRSFEDRKEFLTKYFNQKPYLAKGESEALAARLWFNKSDVSCHFSTKRNRCMRSIQRNKTVVLLGFNMAELKKVKHDLFIPEVESAKTPK